MKLWMRKITVVLVTIMTLGMYVPPIHINTNADENKEAVSPGSDHHEDVITAISDKDVTLEQQDDDTEIDYVSAITEKAREQTIAKLGPRIVNQIDDEFMTIILPKMEETLNTILTETGEENLQYYGITESPSDGFGERIFNVHDYQTNKDVAKFHVRRDNRPLEGYWFNFHYHLRKDGFEEHHEIGEIYWDKNIPPKWMA